MIMHFITAFSLLCFLIQRIKGLPYSSMTDLYDTNYEYEFGENQAREEVFITQTPQFLSQPLDMVVNEGHTLRLPCLVDRLDGFVLLWRKNNQNISVGSQIIDKSNSKIQGDEAENGNTLVIHQADNTDEAEYVCSVSAYRKTELKHNIRIRVQPVITTSPKEPLIVNEGDPAMLSCQLQLGTPIPKLKWGKCEEGSFLSGVDEVLENVLKFESVTRDDSECYVCEADNGFAEEPVTSKVMLVVEYPPSVQIQKTEDSSDVTTIICVVEAEPEAEVTWLKDGETIDNASQRIIVNKNALQLVDIDEEYYGSYSCKAKNHLGSAEKSVKISGKESDADSFTNIGESKEIYDRFKNSQHEPSKEKGYIRNIHESETLIQDNENGIDITRPKKSSGKIYFARVPALYTLPEKESKPLPIKRSHILESRPRNVNDFLKLLRIFHQPHAPRDETNSIHNEDNHTVEHTTHNKLLRSTHSYVGHLNTQLESKSVIERDQVNERSEPEMNIQDRMDSEERKPTNDEKKIKYEEAKLKAENNQSRKGKEIPKLTLTNSESSSINGRYLEENEILTENTSLKDPIETDILYTSNTSAMLRGHHAKQINIEHMKAEDIFVQLNKTNEENENIGNPLDEINGKIMSYNDINKDEPKVKEESQQKETAIGKAFDWFPAGKVGTRYLDDSQIKEMPDDKTVDENGKYIPVFRGQHLSQTTLQNIKSDEQYPLAGFDEKKKLPEPRMKSENFDGDRRQTLQVTETGRKNNYADQILTNSRYINEDQIKEEREETQEDIIETKSKALRGHHSIQSNIADTGEGDIEISSSNSGVTKSLGSSLEIDDHAEPNGQTLNNEQVEKEGTSATKETMYPKEIMNIEKLFFTKLSNIELPQSEAIYPLVPPKEKVHSQEMEMTSKLAEDGENDATHHPLQIPKAEVYAETKVQFRGNHGYEKGLKNVNSETVIGKNNYKKSSEWSKPLRGDHSYNKRIGEDNGNKQNKKSRGPHPFRSLRLRVP